MIHLIIGLGNPEIKYENTRHNLGFRVVDLLAGKNAAWENKYRSQFFKLGDVIMAKPQTYMNESGEAVREILKFYPQAQLIVIHDELDLPLGTIKIMKNISSAGHNGVQSIIDELNTKDFIRIRLGINNPETRGPIPGDEYVLQNFLPKEEEIVKALLQKAKLAAETIQTDGFELAQNRFNG